MKGMDIFRKPTGGRALIYAFVEHGTNYLPF